ncbi:MAG TPA: HlyD family efflux transporter periplasmic adaptor subunit [Verrucomicrobiae bacterium]|nr:HlyD family efflux transporter periplasmic adaptor subunit [Verrucomicrobiae bacterium]
MDIARPDLARKRRRTRLLVLLTAAVLLGVTSFAISRLKPAAPTVEKASIVTGIVKRGPMLRDVRGTGTLVPEDILWIPTASAGRIQKINVWPGAAVEADTVLVELSNPELEKDYSDAKLQLTLQQAQFEKTKVQLESERLTQESLVARTKTEFEQAKLEAEADEALAKEGLMATLTSKSSRTRADNLGASYLLEQERLEIHAQEVRAQLKAETAELDKSRAQVELKQGQVEGLKIRAGLAGVLQWLGDKEPLRLGQQLGVGASVARVADPKRLKAEIKIAETQAKDVQLGQTASIDTRNGVIPGHVVRIDPAVQANTVTVDVALDGPLPKGARPDLTVEGTITLEHLEDVLFVDRPVNCQPESKGSLFRVVEEGSAAVRVPVVLGRSSVTTIELREGLQLNDQVILSDMSQWEAYDRVRLR